jgi:hypothetical protein
MSHPPILCCEGCGEKITDAGVCRIERWLQLPLPRPPLLCWVCLRLKATNDIEAAQNAKYMNEGGY